MIKRFWRGEVSLLWSFLGFGILGGGTMHLALFTVLLGITEVPDDDVALLLVGAMLLVILISVWIGVGIWRSAGRFSGDEGWKYLARGGVLFGLLLYVIMVVSVIFPDQKHIIL